MANAATATIAKPNLFFTVLLRVQGPSVQCFPTLPICLVTTYRLVGIYYRLDYASVKGFEEAHTGFPQSEWPNHNC